MSYRKVDEMFWTDPSITSLSNDARQIALYLLTSPQNNMIGCFHAPKRAIVFALFPKELEDHTVFHTLFQRVSDGFDELVENGFIRCDEKSGWVWIVNFLKYNEIPNPKAGMAAMRIIRAIPMDLSFYPEMLEIFRFHGTFNKNGEKYLTLRLNTQQITLLIQAHRRRYGIDTVSIPGTGVLDSESRTKVRTKLSKSESDTTTCRFSKNSENRQADLGLEDMSIDEEPIQVPDGIPISFDEDEHQPDLVLEAEPIEPEIVEPEIAQSGFEDWWMLWTIPGSKRGNRPDAKRVFENLIRTKKRTFEQLAIDVQALMEFHLEAGTPVSKIPHPVTWLRGERWNDELIHDNPINPRISGNGTSTNRSEKGENAVGVLRAMYRYNRSVPGSSVASDEPHEGQGSQQGSDLGDLGHGSIRRVAYG